MKILIIRFSSIGDIVLTTPVIRCVKQQVAGATVHMLTKSRFAGILQHNPYIDRVIPLEEGASLADLSQQLKAEDYDYVLDLHHNLRTWQIKRRLGAKTKVVSFDKLNLEKWLLVNLKINRMPQKHIVDRYLDTARELGVHNDGKGLDYFIPEADDIAGELLPKEELNRYTAICIGGQHNTKKLPVAKLVELCNQLPGLLILLGGKEDIPAAEQIREQSTGKIMNLCGQLSLNRSASLVKHAGWVITHDTGLMHIAAAFNKKIISVWGNTVPEFGMYPYLPDPASVMMEVNGLSCRPCSKIGYEKCPKGHFKCMVNQDTGAMAQLVQNPDTI